MLLFCIDVSVSPFLSLKGMKMYPQVKIKKIFLKINIKPALTLGRISVGKGGRGRFKCGESLA